MSRDLSRAELDELLPAYALDALDPDERDQVRSYLRREPSAREEVASLREAASMLPSATMTAPSSLWDRIECSLADGPPRAHEPPPLGPRPGVAETRDRPRRPRPALLMAAVVVALLAITASAIFGVEVARQQSRIDHLAAVMHHNTLTGQAEAAKMVPGARTVMLTAADASHTAEIVMLPDGAGYLMHADLPRLAHGRTYQLWVKTGAPDSPRMISAGVLGRDLSVTAFRVAAPVMGLEVTAESDPGAQVPSPTPILAAELS